MAEPTSRRGFLRALVRNAGEAIVDAAGVTRDEQPEPPPKPPRARRPPSERRRRVEPGAGAGQAPPVTRTLSIEEVLDLAAEEGLEDAPRRACATSRARAPA